MEFNTDGLILREVNVGDNDKMITLLTADRGRFGVMAKRTRSIKNKMMTATQLFTYGNYDINERSGYYWLKNASAIEPFYGLRTDITDLALASYIADVVNDISGEGEAAVSILRLTLNSFYAISKKIRDRNIIKAVFELRAAGFSGYMPDLSRCAACGSLNSDKMYLDVMNGCLICSKCYQRESEAEAKAKEAMDIRPLDDIYNTDQELAQARIILPLSGAAVEAMRYILGARAERVYSFNVEGAAVWELCSAAEAYLLHHLERGFDTLDFYRSLENDSIQKKGSLLDEGENK